MFAKLLGLDLLRPVLPGDRANAPIRWAIYAYALLWVFEGALRKWFLPGLSDALLLARDPVVMLIYALALARGIFPFNGFVLTAAGMTFFGFGAAMSVGHADLYVALFGARAMLLHVPLIFIVPRVMDARHVLFLARLTLYLALPMTVLLAIQFLSPPTAWVNKGLGGVGTAGFSGAMGKFRPPGTWSFITGPAAFYPFVTACWFLWILHRRKVGLLGLAAGAAILVACPVSISRLLMLGCVIVAGAGLFALFRQGAKSAALALRLTLAVFLVLVALSTTTIFKEGNAAFADRWSTATVGQGGVQATILGRVFDTILAPVTVGFDAPVFGYGLGAGTNAGAKLLIGRRAFLAGEGEFSRLVMENGLIFGWAWIIWRIVLTGYLLRESLLAWKRKNVFPMLIFSAVGYTVLQGQWAQPTQLGYACLGAGLVLAACRGAALPRGGKPTAPAAASRSTPTYA